MKTRTFLSILSYVSKLAGAAASLVLLLGLPVLPLAAAHAETAGDSSIGPLDAGGIHAAMERHDLAIESDRQVVLSLLGKPAVRSMAADAALDIGRAESRVRTMDAGQLAQVAPQARAAMRAFESTSAIHGADTLVISATTLIIVLLIIIIILVAD